MTPTPDKAAAGYEAELRKFFGSAPPAFDLQLLGLGSRGPYRVSFSRLSRCWTRRSVGCRRRGAGQPSAAADADTVVLNQARNTFFLVVGAEKREIIAALRDEPVAGPASIPAGRIQPVGRVLWFLDEAAAG